MFAHAHTHPHTKRKRTWLHENARPPFGLAGKWSSCFRLIMRACVCMPASARAAVREINETADRSAKAKVETAGRKNMRNRRTVRWEAVTKAHKHADWHAHGHARTHTCALHCRPEVLNTAALEFVVSIVGSLFTLALLISCLGSSQLIYLNLPGCVSGGGGGGVTISRVPPLSEYSPREFRRGYSRARLARYVLSYSLLLLSTTFPFTLVLFISFFLARVKADARERWLRSIWLDTFLFLPYVLPSELGHVCIFLSCFVRWKSAGLGLSVSRSPCLPQFPLGAASPSRMQ